MGDAIGEVAGIGLRSTKIMTSRGVLVTVPNSEVMNRFTYNSNAGVPECMVTTDVAVPVGADPDVLLRVGREVAIACPYTHLGHKSRRGTRRPGADRASHARDHQGIRLRSPLRHAMQTDLLRRAKREFLALGIVKAWELPKAQ